MVDEDTLEKIWKIANEVSAQQQTNQDLASGLRSQLRDLKVRTTIASTCGLVTHVKEAKNGGRYGSQHINRSGSYSKYGAWILIL